MGKRKSDRLFQENRRYQTVDEKRQYRARRTGSDRRQWLPEARLWWLPLEPAVVSAFPVIIAAKAPHRNAARLYYDFSLSKERQEMLRGMQRIPVRKDVEPNPPRLFRGYKRVVENPEVYTDFEGVVRLYNLS